MTKRQTKIAESRNALQEARKMSDHELLCALAALTGFIENARTRHLVLEGVLIGDIADKSLPCEGISSKSALIYQDLKHNPGLIFRDCSLSHFLILHKSQACKESSRFSRRR